MLGKPRKGGGVAKGTQGDGVTTKVRCWGVWLDTEAIEVQWQAIVAPAALTVARRPLVASVPVARVHPTACLCVACGRVSETVRDCPWCESVAMLNLSRILDRM